jgi:hypothetical protein
VTQEEGKSKLLFATSDIIYLGMEPPTYILMTNSNSFVLKYYGGEEYFKSEETLPPIPRITRKYKITNDKMKEKIQ